MLAMLAFQLGTGRGRFLILGEESCAFIAIEVNSVIFSVSSRACV